MINIYIGLITRIFSNSYLNVFQKILAAKGQKSSVINFYSYFGLSLISLILLPQINLIYTTNLVLSTLAMGVLGALGNYFIIKALSIGELSSLAPINSYKPIVALFVGYFYLKEIPSIFCFIGVLLITLGTFIISEINGCFNKKAVFYRILALIFSGTEAIFIKKIILLTNISTAFILWSFAGLFFSIFFVTFAKHKLKIYSIKYQFLLILFIALMQYSTNYVFSKMNVGYALALFQLSTILSVFLGVNVFKENNFKRKIIASIIMVIGATIIILN